MLTLILVIVDIVKQFNFIAFIKGAKERNEVVSVTYIFYKHKVPIVKPKVKDKFRVGNFDRV